MNYDKEPELPDPAPVVRRSRWLPGWLAAVVLAGLGGSFYYWWMAPPAGRTADGQGAAAEIARLEGRLALLAEDLARLGADSPPADQLKLIEEAVAGLDRLRRLRAAPRPQDEVRFAEWQARLGDVRARESNRLGQDAEAAANALLATDRPAGVEKLKEALRLQREVNAGLATPVLKNYAREARLQQEVERLEAEPLQAEAQARLAQARACVAAGRWQDALGQFGRARAIQLQLNRDYARTRFSDLLAIDRIDAEMAALNANEAHDQLEALVGRARAAAAAQKLDEADALLAEAIARQQLINEQFAKSRFVSMERLEQLEADRQTLRAGAAFGAVAELDRTAAGHLRRRELFQAQLLITQALEQLEAAVARSPKAGGLGEDLRQRLNYLGLRPGELGPIQDQIYELLLPQPGNERFALLRTEVPQSLYERVMNGNPSRNPGRALPVDSVTFAEAGEFCRRLGWVLGATVRLPTEAEFRQAVGNTTTTAAHAWGLENGPGKSRPAGEKPANALGFHDLLGNVAEWLAADAAGDSAPVAGGSFAESRGQLQALPVRRVLKTERARTNGFRVVVEIDLAAAK